jgi:phage shock protein A
VESMNDAMVLRQLNYDLRIARNGLKIVKVQANVIEVENQDLKCKIHSLKIKLQNANEDKLATISAERKRWAREDLLAIKIGDLEQQAKGIEDVVNDCAHSMEATQVYVADLDCRVDDLRKQAKALKDQG